MASWVKPPTAGRVWPSQGIFFKTRRISGFYHTGSTILVPSILVLPWSLLVIPWPYWLHPGDTLVITCPMPGVELVYRHRSAMHHALPGPAGLSYQSWVCHLGRRPLETLSDDVAIIWHNPFSGCRSIHFWEDMLDSMADQNIIACENASRKYQKIC